MKSIAAALGVARWRRASGLEAADDGADAGEQFTQIEGLRQIIVGAELEADHAVDVVATVTGDDDYRNV